MCMGGKSFHKKDWLKLGALVGAGTLLPALPGLLGGAAAAGGAASGAAAGGAALGGGTVASALTAPVAGSSALATSMLAPAVTPAITPGLASMTGLGLLGEGTAFGATAGQAAALGNLGITAEMSNPGMWSKLGDGLETWSKINKLTQLASGEQQQPAPSGARPQAGAADPQAISALEAIYPDLRKKRRTDYV